MYNRYIRRDDGVYERIPVQEPPPSDSAPPPPGGSGRQNPLRSILARLHLDSIDTGDLILLLLIFLLFREGEDEELLIALGLLLIL